MSAKCAKRSLVQLKHPPFGVPKALRHKGYSKSVEAINIAPSQFIHLTKAMTFTMF